MDTTDKKNIEQPSLRNEEVQEIMGRMPRGITWWNLGITLAAAVMFLLGHHFFRFPSKVEFPVTVTAYPGPMIVTAPADGTLAVCNVTNGQSIHSGQAIATIATDSNYIPLKARMGGRIEAERLYPGRNVSKGDTLLYIIPPRTSAPVCYGHIPTATAGEVKCGQTVRLRITGYPESDYGFIHGTVAHVSSLPAVNGSRYVEIHLPASLTTSNGRAIPFTYGMSGQAEIITGKDSPLKLLP